MKVLKHSAHPSRASGPTSSVGRGRMCMHLHRRLAPLVLRTRGGREAPLGPGCVLLPSIRVHLHHLECFRARSLARSSVRSGPFAAKSSCRVLPPPPPPPPLSTLSRRAIIFAFIKSVGGGVRTALQCARAHAHHAAAAPPPLRAASTEDGSAANVHKKRCNERETLLVRSRTLCLSGCPSVLPSSFSLSLSLSLLDVGGSLCECLKCLSELRAGPLVSCLGGTRDRT